jgi:putative methionine-R-sulfoxide reductase with GAF domain
MPYGSSATDGWQLIVGMMIILPPLTLVISGLGVIVGLIILITSYFYARQTLPARDVRRILIASLGVGALTAMTDALSLEYRLQVPILQNFAPAITLLTLASMGFFAAREAWGHSLRNKLMVALTGSTLVTAAILSAYLFVSTTNTLQQELERELGQHTESIARQISALFNEQITALTSLSLNEILETAAEDAVHSYEGDASAIQSTLKARDEQWQAADAAGNDNDPLVQQHLHNAASQELAKFQKAFPDHVELFITDSNGGLVAASNRTSDYYQADEAWWKAAYNNGQGATYISEPKYDQSAGIFGIQIALPIRDGETNQLVGIVRTTYQTSALKPILGEAVGETGETILYMPGRPAFVFHQGQLDPMDPNTFNELQAVVGQGMIEMDYEDRGAIANAATAGTGTPSVVIQTSMRELGQDTEFNKLGWVVAFHQSQNEAYAPINASLRGAVIVSVIAVLLVVAGAYALSLLLVRPIAQLTKTAEEIASGNLGSRAEVSSTDEIGTLADTFNRMTSQLQETLKDLEQRVAARTRDLAIVAEVGTATASILESKGLLQEVVDLTKERFHLYHSHIYLLDDEGKNLVLTAGAGEPGRIMAAEGRSIPLDREQSLVARAAREQKGVTVNDVTQAPDFLPNPLLPDTRSELAVPMIIGGNVIGVFDIQSEQVGRFTESDVNIQTTLAAQLATSIQNVRSFERSRKQAELESLVNVIGQKIQRTTSIEETLQTAIRELGTAVGASRVRASVRSSSSTDSTGMASSH